MDSELQDLSSKPQSPTSQPNLEDVSEKDDSPLLSSTTTTSTCTSRTTTGADKSSSSTPLPSIEELEKKYAAFVRHDVYGAMGRGELPWTEKFLLGIALITLLPIRVVLATTVVVLYYLICRVCTLFMAPNREDGQEDYAHMGGWRRTVLFWSGRVLSRIMLFAFGFYWIHESSRNPEIDGSFNNEADSNDQSEENERPGVIISNHVSHMDILYHMSSSFPSFVAKRSVGKLPLVGLISKCLGCVYVQRESKSSDTKGVSAVVNERIQEAHRDKSAPMMMLFPEGTTTNGDYILPFKTGAFLAKAPVLPVILRYPYERFSPAWDSITGVRHVILLLCQFVNNMTVTRLPIYYPSQEEKDNPKLYAENVRRLMAREGNLIKSDIGLAEKRVYHAALNGLLCQR
ncbi:lysophospholipid acyltransferase LPEAT1 isoform X2 [Cynara cardunculus var. scolymus]|uniref:lysophospholipid acyltransferase LPEAT1 isoform X2 n=1 Tax=Cynara cardunculus var. scolymus TaxID=59895 RepID=UPI000D627D1C|nr:lysophospholipid acyltransferase LPEAT1 isoform X2 [Cynara cardunculus var. scolymus]